MVFTAGDASVWRDFAAASLNIEHELRWRAHVKPSDLPLLLKALARQRSEGRAFSWHAGLGDGRLRVMQSVKVDQSDAAAQLNEMRRTVEAHGGSLILESAPEEIKREVRMWNCDEANASLMRRVKQQLDPQDLLNAGFFR
jgi:FAD/FMN-containing dehydrogenase